jgi:hypothetical protein
VPKEIGNGETFTSSEAMATYSYEDRRFYVVQKKTSHGQVKYSKLPPHEKKIFDKSRAKEVKSLTVDTGAVTLLSLEESRRFVEQHGWERVIDSLWVDRYKPTEEGPEAKSRWCAVGWQDPDILDIERSAPMPTTTSLYAAMQVAADRKWYARVKDVKTAFLQSKRTNRKVPLACRMPRDGTFEGAHPNQLLLLNTEVYGLVSGPAWWRRTLLEKLVEKGYVINCYERCVLTLPSLKDEPTKGIVVLEVDDVMEFGDHDHDALMCTLEQELRFGKKIFLRDVSEGVFFAGRRVKQFGDASFAMDMEEFIHKRLDEVKLMRRRTADSGKEELIDLEVLTGKRMTMTTELPKGLVWSNVVRRQTYDLDTGELIQDMKPKGLSTDELHEELDKPRRLKVRLTLVKESPSLAKDPLNEQEQTQLRAVIAGVNWAAREGRPDASAAASVVASSFPNPTVQDARDINNTVRHLKATPLQIRIFSFKPGTRRMLLIADSAFDTSGQERSQGGFLVGFCNDQLFRNYESPISLVSWRSRRVRRKATSSLLCEALNLSMAAGELEWLTNYMRSLEVSGFDPREITRTPPLDLGMMTTVIKHEDEAKMDPASIVVVDAKALYDTLQSEQTLTEDRRASLEAASIRESLRTMGAAVRWIPHTHNPSDALTKHRGAHLQPLRQLLRTGKMRLRAEKDQLEDMASSRERLGYTPRPKTAGAGNAHRRRHSK